MSPIKLLYFSLALLLSSGNTIAMNNRLSVYDLYARRDQGSNYIHEAKKIYLNTIQDKKQKLEVREEALDRYARLAVFEGEVGKEMYRTSDERAAEIFQECIDVADLLSEKHVKQLSGAHLYWRANCLGLWLSSTQSKNPLKLASRAKKLLKLIKTGQEKFKSLDGYGFDRLEAGLHIRAKMFYNPKKAITLLDGSLQDGTNTFITYILKAEALVLEKDIVAAKNTLISAINDLSRRLSVDRIPEITLAENKIFLEKMKNMLVALNNNNF